MCRRRAICANRAQILNNCHRAREMLARKIDNSFLKRNPRRLIIVGEARRDSTADKTNRRIYANEIKLIHGSALRIALRARLSSLTAVSGEIIRPLSARDTPRVFNRSRDLAFLYLVASVSCVSTFEFSLCLVFLLSIVAFTT